MYFNNRSKTLYTSIGSDHCSHLEQMHPLSTSECEASHRASRLRRMLGHYDGRVQCETVAVAFQAALQHNIPGLRRKRLAVALAECHEHSPIVFLIMRQFAPIVVHAGQGDSGGMHS